MAGEIMRGRLWTERRIDNVRETEFLFVEKDEFCLCTESSMMQIAMSDTAFF